MKDSNMRRSIESRLRESQRFLEAVATASAAFIYVFDMNELRATYVNRSILVDLGYPASPKIDLLADFKRFMPEEDMPHLDLVLKEWRELLDGQTRKDEYRLRDASGSIHWFIAREIVFSRDAAGQVHRILGTLFDVTESKRLEQRMELALDGTELAMWDLEILSGKFTSSPRLIGMLGYSPGEIAVNEMTFAANVHPEDSPKFSSAVRAHLRGETCRLAVDYRMRHKDGHWLWIVSRGKVVERDINGRALRIAGTNRDITDRKQIEESLSESELRFRTVIEQSPIGVAFSRDGITVDVNTIYLQMFGYDDIAEVLGKPLLNQIAPQCRADVENRIEQRIQGKSIASSYETTGLRRDGTEFPLFISAKRMVFKDGPLTCAFLIDNTRQKTAEEEIRRLAFYDHLTALPNRRLLQDRLEQALLASRRSGRRGALLFIDLDDFKSLNDTLGHTTGDALLQQVAVRLRSCLREIDSVARLGGDEFVVILEDLSGESTEAAQQTEAISRKILAALNPPCWLGSHEYHCTASIGATLFGEPKQANEELIKQADIAMYQAKKAGRNNMRFFDPKMQAAISAQALLVSELRQALDQRQFRLFYQVQVDGAGGAFGAEALIRWIHPVRGLVAPTQFIALAEETDLILPIGQWVLETACAQIKAWAQGERTRDLSLCINVSAKQFYRSDFVDSVRNAVERNAIRPERLTLELTESLLLENIEDTIATMAAVRKIGVRFSLDDFGTGYSSLQYLKRLPLHQLKIDQSFVRDIAIDSSDAAIVRTIVAMARSLNLEVIAEGVETENQRQLLVSNGCDKFQGFLFGRPAPIEQFDATLKSKLTTQSSA